MKNENPRHNEHKPRTTNFVFIEKKIDEREKEVAKNQPHANPKPTRLLTCVGIDFLITYQNVSSGMLAL